MRVVYINPFVEAAFLGIGCEPKILLTYNTHCTYNQNMKFQEIERVLLNDGWSLKTIKGSHYQYVHPVKPGKVTIPYHTGDIAPIIINSILKQAGLN